VKMPDMDGLALLEKLREQPEPPAVVMISGHGDVSVAVDAVRRGAQDFLEKPLDQNRVLVALQNALRQTRLAKENRVLRRALNARWELIGTSPALRTL